MRRTLVAACLIVAACSKSRTSAGPDAGAPPALSIDPAAFAAKFGHPCDLLQRSDAEAILGSTDLQQQEEPGGPGDAHCIWAVNGARGFVELRVHLPTRKDGFDRPLPDRLPVPGVGDRAYIQKRLSWGHLDVIKGDQTFFVQIEHGSLAAGRPHSPEEVRIETIALGRTIASRL